MIYMHSLVIFDKLFFYESVYENGFAVIGHEGVEPAVGVAEIFDDRIFGKRPSVFGAVTHGPAGAHGTVFKILVGKQHGVAVRRNGFHSV